MPNLTPKEKAELDGQGYTFSLLKNVASNRRCYWDPKSNSWTAPLPGDALRTKYYLRKGFLLEKPEQEN
jgi:hypothetical protein